MLVWWSVALALMVLNTLLMVFDLVGLLFWPGGDIPVWDSWYCCQCRWTFKIFSKGPRFLFLLFRVFGCLACVWLTAIVDRILAKALVFDKIDHSLDTPLFKVGFSATGTKGLGSTFTLIAACVLCSLGRFGSF